MTIAGKQVWLGTFSSREAAQRAVERAQGRNRPVVRTVAELAAAWDALDPRRRTEETSRHRQQMVAGFVRLHAGELLETVDPVACQSWATAHAGSVRYLRSMFGVAVRLELLERNPWDRVVARTEKRPRRAFTFDEVQQLATAARCEWHPGPFGEMVADMYLLTAGAGLRLSEVAGARVCDGRALGRISVEGKGSKPRTAFVMPWAQTAQQSAMRRRLGKVWVPYTPEMLMGNERLLFRSVQNRPLDRGKVSKIHNRLLKRLGWTDAPTFHGLRHYYATTLLDHGAADVDVAVAMGHTDELGRPDVTHVRATYGHMDSEAALARLEAVTATQEGSSAGHDSEGAGPTARGAGAA